jgi:hypothetical protein
MIDRVADAMVSVGYLPKYASAAANSRNGNERKPRSHFVRLGILYLQIDNEYRDRSPAGDEDV